MNNFYLLLYIVMWVIAIFVYQNKRRSFDSGSLLLFSYLSYAVCSFLLYNNRDTEMIIMDLSLFPFLYLFMMLLLASSPILSFDTRRVRNLQFPSPTIIAAIAFLYMFFSLLSIPTMLHTIREGMTTIFLDSMGARDIYLEGRDAATASGHGSLEHLPIVLSSAFGNIGLFLMFYLLLNPRKHKWIIVGLAFSIVITVLSDLATSQRGGPVRTALTMIATFFLFKNFYSDKINRFAKKAGIVVGIIFLIPLVAVTIGRFGEDSASSSVIDYLGQENLYFNYYGLDDNGIRYGDRTIPLFKRMVGIGGVPHNYMERRAKYPHLKINDEQFSTFVGDFTIDFGPILAFLIFLGFNLVVNSKTKIYKGYFSFRKLLLLHFVLCVCIQGGMSLFSFADVGGNLQIIAYFLVYIYSKYDIKHVCYVGVPVDSLTNNKQ